MDNHDHLLKPVELAHALGVTRQTIYYWVGRKEIPFLKIGKHLRFDLATVLRYFVDKTQERDSSWRSMPPLLEPIPIVGGSAMRRRSLTTRAGILPKLTKE